MLKNNNIYWIISHPNLKKGSKMNFKIYNELKNGLNSKNFNYQVRDLYDEYSDFKIDVKKEQEYLVNSDLVIIQFPIYWYSSPALLKEWFDKVFEYDFAYGPNGNKLTNKKVIFIATSGAPKENYLIHGSDKQSLEEYLSPIFRLVEYCGMEKIGINISYKNMDKFDVKDILKLI